jgi:hypothetical protein
MSSCLDFIKEYFDSVKWKERGKGEVCLGFERDIGWLGRDATGSATSSR